MDPASNPRGGTCESFQGPNRILVAPVLEEVELFRVVKVDRPHHPSDLVSNYERQARLRPHAAL